MCTHHMQLACAARCPAAYHWWEEDAQQEGHEVLADGLWSKQRKCVGHWELHADTNTLLKVPGPVLGVGMCFAIQLTV